MKKLLFAIPLLLILITCSSDDTDDYDCSTVLCVADFSDFFLEVVDNQNDENLLTNETYTSADITISGSETVEFTIQDVLDTTVLSISDSEWETGTYNYILTIGEAAPFDLTLNLERTGGEGCCSNILILESFEVNDEVQPDDEAPIYTLRISN